MKKSMVILATVLLASSADAQVSNKVASAQQALCANGTRPISEVPLGITDGTTRLFFLSADPAPVGRVRLFDNGIEQELGRDFLISDRVLTFLPGDTPMRGDVLNAFYRETVCVTPAQAGISQPALQTSHAHSRDEDFSIRLLRQELESESSHAQSFARDSNDVPQPSRQVAFDSSIRMLVRTIDLRHLQVKQLKGRKGMHRSRILEGIEGTGDDALPSIFEELDPSESLLGEEDQRGLDLSQHPGAALRHTPESLRMLSRSLLASRSDAAGSQ